MIRYRSQRRCLVPSGFLRRITDIYISLTVPIRELMPFLTVSGEKRSSKRTRDSETRRTDEFFGRGWGGGVKISVDDVEDASRWANLNVPM